MCPQLEEGARKAVEQATSSSAILKLYNKWAEKSQQLQSGEGEREGSTEKKGGGGGLLKTIKSAINKKEASVSERVYDVCGYIIICMCVRVDVCA